MKRLSTQLLLSTLLITLSFALGIIFELFEKLAWYDEFVHFLAGVWVGIIIIWFIGRISTSCFLSRSFKTHPMLTIILLALAVGLAWEIFEFGIVQYLLNTYEYRSGLQPSQLDTFSDLLMDILGAGLITYIIKRKQIHHSRSGRI